MSLGERIKAKLSAYRPVLHETFVTSMPLPFEPGAEPEQPSSIWYKVVRDAEDEHLEALEDDFRLAAARRYFIMGMWCVLAIDGDKPVGKVWITPVSMVMSPRHGPTVRLAADEIFLFDLWIAADYRRTGLAVSLCNEFLRQVQHVEGPPKKWLHGYVFAENTPSKTLMEQHYGMWTSQAVKQITIGPRIALTVPLTGRPRMGPFTIRGRHSGHTNRVPGRPADYVMPLRRPDSESYEPETQSAPAPPIDPGPDWYVPTAFDP
ncbi:MAG: hypothetical protein JJLCMIEE_02983 [Acidimicrobiales bacterium]|nr:hypothetical protein [Acidimicrobiales bacterium]